MKTIQYPMIADTTGNICRTFGTLNETDGLPHRATFILDPDGNLKVIEMNDNSFGRNTKELLRKLETAKFVQETRAKSARPAGSREKKRSSRREQVAATKVVILKRHWRSMKKVRLERG